MKRSRWRLLLGVTLIGVSILFYLLHYLIFRDARHIFICLIGDIAFLFIQVLLVTLIIDEVPSFRERRLLMAVFHLTEELEARSDVSALSGEDKLHIAGDMKRVYGLLTAEWFDCMRHLRDNYPYLFSFAIRTNPFDPEAVPEIGEVK